MQNTKIKIVSLKNVLDQFVQQIKAATLIPFIGAGFTSGSTANSGNVPDGKTMKSYMIKMLESNNHNIDLTNTQFSQVAKYYNRIIDKKTRNEYIISNFTDVQLDQRHRNFLELGWPYIYTLNIDDAIEKNSKYKVIEPGKQFDESALNISKVVFKLHGDAKSMALLVENENISVFDIEQYISSLKKNRWILDKLKQDYIDKNILFIGCSLNDELDLMHVVSMVKDEYHTHEAEKYYLTDKEPNSYELIDLESFGITTVVVADSYEDFYNSIYNIKNEIITPTQAQLMEYKNIPISQLGTSDNNDDYILYEKAPFNKKNRMIYLPYFFVERDITKNIIDDFCNNRIQIVYGKRVSGKSYLLLDLYNRINNRDRYYFDSRARLNKNNIEFLISNKNTVILVDTYVLSYDILSYVLHLNVKQLAKNNINIVICVNSSNKESMLELRDIDDNAEIKIYYLLNYFIANGYNSEYVKLKRKLTSINLMYFEHDKTILDGIIKIQTSLTKLHSNIFSNFAVDPKEYLQIACLLVLAYKKKLTSTDMVMFGFSREPFELEHKLEKAIEHDYHNLITATNRDSSYFQLVCNAQVWLISYIAKISTESIYFNSIVEAVIYIAKKLYDSNLPTNRKRELFEFIKFDNLNFLLGGARVSERNHSGARRLIQKIYSELKPLLGDDYQFNHQHAKCLLWGVDDLSVNERSRDLNMAYKSIMLALQQIENDIKNSPKNKFLQISLAHAKFTLCMIQIKFFFFNKTEANFREGVHTLMNVITNQYNKNAHELYDSISNDENDNSVSKFMDLLLDESTISFRKGIEKECSEIITFRTKLKQSNQ